MHLYMPLCLFDICGSLALFSAPGSNNCPAKKRLKVSISPNSRMSIPPVYLLLLYVPSMAWLEVTSNFTITFTFFSLCIDLENRSGMRKSLDGCQWKLLPFGFQVLKGGWSWEEDLGGWCIGLSLGIFFCWKKSHCGPMHSDSTMLVGFSPWNTSKSAYGLGENEVWRWSFIIHVKRDKWKKNIL